MDLSLTETQQMLQNAVQEFMEAELPKSRVLEIDDSDTGFADDLWGKMAEMGLPGMLVAEQYGGSGNSVTDMAVVFEQLGYYASSSPLLDSGVLAASTINAAGSDAQKQALLPAIASGDRILTVAVTEEDYGWGPGTVTLQASQSGDGYTLNGTKLFIPWAHVADQIIVVARTSGDGADGITLFLVDRTASGVSTRLQSGWIGDKVCEVNLSNVQVGADNVLGSVGQGWSALQNAMDTTAAILSAYMAGGTQKAYDMAREYSQSRIAFGVPIGTFQRVQDHVIDAVTQADEIKWTAYEATWKLDEGRDDASLAVSAAKAVASTGYSQACDASHHVHGGIGTDLDFGLTHYTKRARTFQHYLGDAIHHRRRAAELLEL